MYSLQNPLNGLETWTNPVIDSHLHFWNEKLLSFFFKWANLFFNDYSVVALMRPEMIAKMPDEYREKTRIAQFLSPKALGEYNTSELIKQIDQAYSDGVEVFKLWLAPRFLDYIELNSPFNLLDERLEPVFSQFEDYKYTISAHIADPDLWYLFLYQDRKKYGEKIDNVNRFLTVERAYPKIKFLATHFACWPENLKELGKILDKHPNLYINTGSTRWMIRELGKNNRQTTEFITKYQDKIIFGTDLHVREGPMNPDYLATRFWSHRIFWETRIETELPFNDPDAPFGVRFTGLNLSPKILNKIYSQNFMRLFNS